MDQSPPGSIAFVAKIHGSAEAYQTVCRDTLRHVDGAVPVYDVETLDQRLAGTLAAPRFYTTAIVFMSCFGLLLAVVGVYGVATHSVAQRTQELGVRLAVGASPRVLRGMLLVQSMKPVALGAIAGILAAAGLGRFLQHLIASAEPVSTGICIAAASLLACAATIAVWTATGRVVNLDPTAALKVE